MRKHRQVNVTVYPTTDKLLEKLVQLTGKGRATLIIQAAESGVSLREMLQEAEALQPQ